MVYFEDVKPSRRSPAVVGTSKGGGTFPSDSNNKWFAVQTSPNREKLASFHLRNQAFLTFLPVRRVTRRHARRIDTVLRPFFPGYLFISLNIDVQRWRSVNGTVGVARLIAHGEVPTAIPTGIIEALLDSCGVDGTVRWRPDLCLGDSVKVIEGPLTGFVGQVERLDDAGRVRVLLEVMGGRVPMLLSHDCVARANSGL